MAIVTVPVFAKWIEILFAHAGIPGSLLGNWESKHPDTIHGWCTMSAEDLKLLLSVSGEETVTLHPVDTDGNMRLLHHVFLMLDGSQKLHLVAINGARAIAEFASVPDEAIRGKTVRRVKAIMVPSLTDVMGCENQENFANLYGGENDLDVASYFKG